MKRSLLIAAVLFVVAVSGGTSLGQKNPRGKRARPIVVDRTQDQLQTSEPEAPNVGNRLANTLDFNNDGKSDFSIYRARSAAANANFEWYVRLNGTSNELYNVWGLASDTPTPADYDGDGKTDIAVWRNDPQPAYYIIKSTDGTFRNFAFGNQNDYPLIVSDFDGDGKDDPAVWREGLSSTFFYQSSRYNGVVSVPWGTFGDTPVSGDFNGDGWADFRVMRDDGNGNAIWLTRFSVPIGTALPPDKSEYFGLVTDDFVPGDFDGDLKSDLCVTRPEGDNPSDLSWVWYVKSSLTGTITRTAWGRLNLDLESPGDYDGDGKTDIAVWRYGPQNGAPANYHILKSSGGQMVIQFGLESQLDTNLSWWNVSAQLTSLGP